MDKRYRSIILKSPLIYNAALKGIKARKVCVCVKRRKKEPCSSKHFEKMANGGIK